jgi:hypothetical protein
MGQVQKSEGFPKEVEHKEYQESNPVRIEAFSNQKRVQNPTELEAQQYCPQNLERHCFLNSKERQRIARGPSIPSARKYGAPCFQREMSVDEGISVGFIACYYTCKFSQSS